MKVDYSKLRERHLVDTATVPCPIWGGDVDLKRATSQERMDAALLIAELEKDDDGAVETGAMVASCIPIVSQTIVDGETRPFDSEEGRQQLSDDPMAVVQLIPHVLALNALGLNADEAVDTAKKNLPTAPSGT